MADLFADQETEHRPELPAANAPLADRLADLYFSLAPVRRDLDQPATSLAATPEDSRVTLAEVAS